MLWAFAIVRPLFDVLEDSPEFFIARGNTGADIVLFAVALTLVPPTLLLLCEVALSPLPRARRALHLGFVGLLVAAIVVQIVEEVDVSGKLLILVALGCGAAGALAYARTRVVPLTLSVLSPAPLLFLGTFLLTSSVSELVLPQDDVALKSTGVKGDTPVVVVVFDEFAGSSLLDRRGEIDATRFPNLAAFARDADWYRNATTVADQTVRAVPAILTGSRAGSDQLPTTSAYPQNVFTLLGEHYELEVDEPITDLCPDELCRDRGEGSTFGRLRSLVDDLSVVSAHLLTPPDLEYRLPAVDQTFAGFRNAGRDEPRAGAGGILDLPSAAYSNRVTRFESFAERLSARGERPPFGFLHIALPHVPWQYLPSGQSYAVTGPETPGVQSERWGDEPWLAAQGHQRYLLQLGFADRLIGGLMRRLRAEGLYDRALIVLTADHGVSFRANDNRRAVTNGNVVDIASVPLFVKKPNQRRGKIDDGPARTLDILATIVETLDARLPSKIDGTPLPRPAPSGAEVAVDRYGGGRVSISFDEFLRRRDASVRRRIEMFGAGDGFADLYAAGPHRELVGQRVADVPPGPPVDFEAAVDYRSGYAAFEADDPEAPAFVTARLTGGARGGETVAIAVNRRIVATTRSYTDGPDVRVGALVPPAAFRAGRNTVEVLAVTGAGREARVTPAGRLAGEGARLVRRNGELVMVPSTGPPIPIESGAVDGFLENLEQTELRTVVTGWASDADHRKPASRVMLFAGDRLLQTAKPSVARDDLVAHFGRPGLARAGFHFTGGPVGEGEQLRVIAVLDGRASELPR